MRQLSTISFTVRRRPHKIVLLKSTDSCIKIQPKMSLNFHVKNYLLKEKRENSCYLIKKCGIEQVSRYIYI